jgi:hypothetical protein
MHGTIRSTVIDKCRLNLYVGIGAARVRVTMVQFPSFRPGRLVNARVTLRGACGATFTKPGQLTGVSLHVQV